MEIDWDWMSEDFENSELLPFEVDALMELVWNFLNSEPIVEISRAQDYIGFEHD